MSPQPIIRFALCALLGCDVSRQVNPPVDAAVAPDGQALATGCPALAAVAPLSADEVCIEARFVGKTDNGLILDHEALITPSGKQMGKMSGMLFALAAGKTLGADIAALGNADAGKKIFAVVRAEGDAPLVRWYLVRASLK